MIAEAIGVTKGALYRHFGSKQAIFDAIVQKMFALDEERATQDNVPAQTYDDAPESYLHTALSDVCAFVCNQFDFWTADPFASLFRKMITVEQYKSPEATKLFQDVIGTGPVRYSEDLLREMINAGQLKPEAEAFGISNLAMQLYAPLVLAIRMADGGEDAAALRVSLRQQMNEFEMKWALCPEENNQNEYQ